MHTIIDISIVNTVIHLHVDDGNLRIRTEMLHL